MFPEQLGAERAVVCWDAGDLICLPDLDIFYRSGVGSRFYVQPTFFFFLLVALHTCAFVLVCTLVSAHAVYSPEHCITR